MRNALTITVLLLTPHSGASAQARSEPVAATTTAGYQVGTGALCDGSAVTRAERRRTAGNVLLVGSLGASLWGVSQNRTPGTAIGGIGLGLGLLATGSILRWSGRPGDGFWNAIIARAKAVAITSSDVRACLHSPDATSVAAHDEEWTYFTRRPWFEPAGRSYGTVSFRFRDSILTDVRRTEVRLPAEQTPVVLAPVGTPSGTP
jgi:hypothetical protein